jgi:hypothetical protein
MVILLVERLGVGVGLLSQLAYAWWLLWSTNPTIHVSQDRHGYGDV